MIFKIAARAAALLLTAVVLLASADILLDRAGEKYNESGAYSSDLLSWEQSFADRGTLTVLGSSFELDLGAIRGWSNRAKSGLSRLFTEVREHLTPDEQPDGESLETLPPDHNASYTQSSTSACTAPRSA